jgi:hypothetical protein
MVVMLQYYNDYGDIIKATLGKAREINKTNCARTMAISLTMLFRELQRDGTRINRQSEDFISLKVRLYFKHAEHGIYVTDYVKTFTVI